MSCCFLLVAKRPEALNGSQTGPILPPPLSTHPHSTLHAFTSWSSCPHKSDCELSVGRLRCLEGLGGLAAPKARLGDRYMDLKSIEQPPAGSSYAMAYPRRYCSLISPPACATAVAVISLHSGYSMWLCSTTVGSKVASPIQSRTWEDLRREVSMPSRGDKPAVIPLHSPSGMVLQP